MPETTSQTTYDQLQKIGETTYLYRSLSYLLELDQETCMPSGGIDTRSKQLKMIRELHHKHATSAKVRNNLSKLIDLDSGQLRVTGLTDEQKASVGEMHRDFMHAAKLPASFIRKFSDATANAVEAWKEAKHKNSFRAFAPHLTKLVHLLQKKADYLGYGDHPYDALIDEYEPKMTVAKLDPLFQELKESLVSILRRRQAKNLNVDETYLTSHYYSPAHQRELSQNIAITMGLPKEHFHLAESAHPFCLALSPEDIRITTHFHKEDFRKGYFATIHEAGHGLYEFGLPKEHLGTPLAEAASFGIHESQSRFWECFIASSHAFWKGQFPHLKNAFPGLFDDLPLDLFVASLNNVTPSLIRIFADEVTYNLHIILRYEIEKGLIEGSISVKQVPKIWNQKMHETLGIVPKTDKEGCLQDIHWSIGAMGYFPSYCLGTLYAGALYEQMIKTHTNWEQKIATGELTFLTAFLRERIHRHGRQFTPLELIEKASDNRPFSPKPYITYLETKFL